MSDFEKRVQINRIIESQLPEFIVSDFPKATEFFKQYYISQEFQGGNVDIVENLDQYLKLDNLVPEVITGETFLSNAVSASDTSIVVTSTKGFPSEYGLLKIDDEIITYTGITTNTFTGCVRGFSGITEYKNETVSFEGQNLVFKDTVAENHNKDSKVTNLSVLFLQEFYKKLKYTFTPGLENTDFVSDLDVGNFIKNARSFYQSKGIEESVKILFKVLYGTEASVLDLETHLIKPSSAEYVRREVVVAENISGDPLKLEGQTVFKSTDKNTNASVSNVEIFTRDNKSYYKLELFIGYNDRDLIEGIFTIPGKTRVLENVSIGSSIISVDSTLGFEDSGILISGNNTINYTSKSINQFFGCSGVQNLIQVGSDIRSDETIYGYEEGDITKRVDLRITGVISDFVPIDDVSLVNEGEKILISGLGELIENPDQNKTYKEVFANSWIYNTSVRFQVSSISGSTFTLLSAIDKSSLKINDRVDVLFRNSNNVAASDAVVTNINTNLNQITLGNLSGFSAVALQSYDIRRKIKKATSSTVNLVAGNNNYISDVLNVYSDESGYGYVASNSLPSYNITEELVEYTIPNGTSANLGGYDLNSQKYSTIKFSSPVRFISGDLVVYTASSPLGGLTSGREYYVSLVSNNEIRLYESKSILGSTNYLEFTESLTSGTHTFTLKLHKNRLLSPNLILRKFPINNLTPGSRNHQLRDSIDGSIGILIDGVEILKPDSSDKVYYGPIEKFEILNSGDDYDIVNPPQIVISPSGIGSNALVEPIIEGSVKQVYVDPQDFDIEEISSISIVGGNGSGCILDPIVGIRFRELEFDTRDILFGGGIDTDNETITFLTDHNLYDGEPIIYNQNGNDPLPIGIFGDVGGSATGTLVSGDQYFAKFVNTKSIKLYTSNTDLISGINTVGFSTSTSSSGIHKFRTLSKKTLSKIEVLNGGSGYQHRKLHVKTSGISTIYDTISFENHGFSNGDVVNYSTTGTPIVGLSTNNRYSISVLDSDSFRLINLGVGGTFTTDLTKNKYVDIQSVGSGYHIFEYPNIEVVVNVSYGSSFSGQFTFTPIVTGKITGAYLYENGSGYGSSILNLQKNPKITLKNGKNAQLVPYIINGRIVDVEVLSGGSEYVSTPEITALGKGSGCILRPVINNGKIVDVIVLNGGIGYDASDTTIKVTPRGFGSIFDIRIRSLTVNDAERFGSYTKTKSTKIFANISQNDQDEFLVYRVYGYSGDLSVNYSDNGTGHSPIIGWAYDGNPIYGPYGYSNPLDVQSGVKILSSGYRLNSSNVFDRPSGFSDGFFIEDYKYDNSGDLDSYNGRFCKTPEFPNGVYAYFSTINSTSLDPTYPYFIGNEFRSTFIDENNYLNQKFDFNNSNLARNTYPYKLNDPYSDYDFVVESYEKTNQVTVVKNVTPGDILDINVIDGGSDYKIGDQINFSEEGTGGSGFRSEVSELVGKDILNIKSDFENYPSCVFVWDTDSQVSAYYRTGFDLINDDVVLVSGISTFIPNLSGSKKIGFTTETVSLAATMTSYTSTPGGKIEDIFVSSRPSVSIGGSIFIKSSGGIETIKVLNDYGNGILRVKRFGTSGIGHTYGSSLNILKDRLTINAKTSKFDSKRNDLVYFNAKDSVGIGTTIGGSVSKTFSIGGISESISVPCRSIYLPNHPFKTGQRVTFTKSDVAGVDSLIVGNDDTNINTFFIPNVTTRTSEVYVINKGRNYIGLTTQVGLTTISEGLFFYSDGSNNSEYLLESNFNQVTGQVDRVVTTVSVAQSHGLKNGDVIKLNVVPNNIVGVGSTSPLSVIFKDNKLLINPVGVNSSSIDVFENTITITNHGYKTGDKIYYDSIEVAPGLTTGTYYVIKDTNDRFRLAETFYDTVVNPQNSEVDIVGTGATIHTFALVNPKIDVTKNSTIKFNLFDSSLSGYNFKIFKDEGFNDEFVSAGNDRNFNVIGVGTVGFGTASYSIRYSDGVPSKLFYALEKSGYISTADKDVINYSQINFVDSEYNGTYGVFGITTNSFKISPSKVPSILTYGNDQVEKMEYTTSSSNTITGAIAKAKIISKGFNFKKLPLFSNIVSERGRDANLVAISTSIGKIKKFDVKDIGYEYSSDKTLRPEAYVSPTVRLDNLDTIDSFDYVNPGSKYLTAPKLLLWNDTTKQVINDSSLIANVRNGTIVEINQIAPIFGIESDPHKIIAVNNNNGVGISSIITSNSGVATCSLRTPLVGFQTNIFKNGDYVFAEGIELIEGSNGTGYNSENYDYNLFKVVSFVNSDPAVLTFELTNELEVGLSTNPGIAKTFQSGYATLVNKTNYPEINVIKKRGKFVESERLFVNTGSGFFESDVYVSVVRDDFIKVSGKYRLKAGDKIKGAISGVIADITSVDYKKSKFEIDYSSTRNIGWKNDTGKISEDYQVTPDNDYYQNLSYAINSKITWDKLSNPVNSIIHPSGMKNFATVGIVSDAKQTVGMSASTTSIVILDILSENRVDTINNFDNTVDFDTRTNPQQSKFLKIQNRKLTDYTECITNRVLIHDDISNRFSSKGFLDSFVEIEELEDSESLVRYLIQVVDPDSLYSQLNELVLQTSATNSILFEKYRSYTDELLGSFSADVSTDGRKVLMFSPTDIFDRDHDIKILKKSFTSSSPISGTQSFGSIKLIGSNVIGISSVGTSSSIGTIAEFSDSDFNGLFANVEITNNLTNEINYIEAIVDFDGLNTYLSEYYFDTSLKSSSSSLVGIVTTIYDSTAGIVSFCLQNNTENLIDVRTSIVGFAATSSGIGTYRFLLSGQPAGSERSARLESVVGVGTTSIRIGSFNIDTVNSVSSIVRVSYGNTSSIHQVSALQDKETVTVFPGPFSVSNNVSGLGTFGGEIQGSNFYLNFYPDTTSHSISVQAYNEVLYTFNDFDNTPEELTYGNTTQSLFLSAYDGINGSRANKLNFNLTYDNTPIYKKTFYPEDSSTLDPSTGIFTIRNHFFNTGEELIYTPKSTFIGVGQTAMGIGATANYLGIVTDRLPERVYPIVITPDTFKLSTRKSYAAQGIAVTFTDYGLGNAHELEMTNKLTKTVISLDGIVQQPITFTPVSHTLQYNGGQISAGISTFRVSGISSIQLGDLLRIDDEYMNIVEVGLSSLGSDRISGIINSSGISTYPTVSVVRGSVGSARTTHIDGSNVQVYRGSFNIVGSEVFFTNPPKGNSRSRRDSSNLPYVKAEYSGRTFLRSNYDTNVIFDDISNQFTGIGKTYTLTVGGINTSGFTIGSGILFINGVFQTPTTTNNSGNNYEFENDTVAGISSVIFTGITSTDGTYIKSDFDINQNQLPRGGLIVSLGSTPGLGYAPLLGAKVRANLNGSGSVVSITGISHTGPGQSISTASYDNLTGIVEITTTTNHNFVGGDRIKLVGLGFTCPSGAGIVSYFPSSGLNYSYDIVGVKSARTFTANVGTSTLPHSYIGFGTVFPWYDLNNGSGYRDPVSIGITDPNHTGSEAIISAVVGAGGTLSFTIDNAGSGYVNPTINISEPIYENLEVVGVSRLGVGSTTETGSNLRVNLKIGPSSNVGIGSTLFLVEKFEISRPGYGFQVGDVFKPVGLVTASGLSEPLSEFQIEVLETFSDNFSSWSFGEMDYIDSIRLLQNGSRTRFPLYYNGQLLSFQIDENSALSGSIDLDSVLVIFVNGVLQKPKVAYQFFGGTSFIFTDPPQSFDKVDIFFYLGQNGVDVRVVDIQETVKIGDELFVSNHPQYTVLSQERDRTIVDLVSSDLIETDNYIGEGIDETIFRPLSWTKQKTDLYINGDVVYKDRDSLTSRIYPTAKIIGDIDQSNSNIFVDDARFFVYEENNYGFTISTFDGLVIQGTDPVAAAATATVSVGGTISNITITNVGSGYSGSTIPVKIFPPQSIGIGIGTTASAVATISNGSISSISITNSGFGYTSSNPPKIILETPKGLTETIASIQNVQGFSGIVTGISTTAGTGGHPLALKINFRADISDAADLQPGYPVLVYNTSVGFGVTSVNSQDSSVVGVGTTFLDNVYIVNSISNTGPDAEMVCNVHSESNVIGILTTGSIQNPIGNISWGRLYGFASRSNPISIGVTGLVVDSGLSTFPTIQRRLFGFRNSGAIRKNSNIRDNI